MRKNRAFTLVELLVVIAIIALLAALLLPALKTARDRGKNAACLSNQRQLAVVVLMYADDNSGWVPGGNWTTNTPAAQQGGWELCLRGSWWTGGTGVWNDKRQAQQQLKQYVNAFSPVWMCPGWSLDDDLIPGAFVVGCPTNNTPFVDMPWTMRNVGFGYEYRPWIQKTMAWYGWDTCVLRLGGPGRPSSANVFNCLLYETWDPTTTRAPHNNRSRWNVSFLDGSVRSTVGMKEGNYSMLNNMPPDADWANWGP